MRRVRLDGTRPSWSMAFDSLLGYQRLFTYVERTLQHMRYVPIYSPF